MQDEKKDLIIKKIQDMFGSKHARVLQHLYSRPPTTFRVNTNKSNVRDVITGLKAEGYEVKPGPVENSYVLVSTPLNKKLSESTVYKNGDIYIQGLSSMIPVIMLDPKPGDYVLDLCAAPGSKTTQIANMTNNLAHITAVDNNRKRLFRLSGNIEIQKSGNIDIVYANGVGLEKRMRSFNNYFDKILVDAPCSNEGRICLTDPESYEYWNPKLPKKLSSLQKKLMFSAVRMLKVQGVVVYSTCTFSKEENEDVVVWVLEKFKDLSMVEVRKILPDGLFTGFFAVKFVKLK